MTRDSSDHAGVSPQPPPSPFNRPGIFQTSLETSPVNTQLRAGPSALGQGVGGFPAFSFNTHAPSTHGSLGSLNHNLMPDGNSATNVSQRQGSARQPPTMVSVTSSTFPVIVSPQASTTLTWVDEPEPKPSASSNKRQRGYKRRLSKNACIWCYKIKKGCDSSVPCERCRKDNRHCVRDGFSSLCMALTIKQGAHYQLAPGNFEIAQAKLEQLKEYLHPLYSQVVVRWYFHSDSQQYHEISVATNELSLHQVDTIPRAPLADMALECTPAFLWPSDPTDNLQENAHRMLGLIAAIKQLYKSDCYTEAVTIPSARVVVFFLMIVYTMELCGVSHWLAKGIYEALPRKPKDSMRHAMRIYLQVIDEMINLQPPNSLLSDILTSLHPRLPVLRALLRRLLYGRADATFDVDDSFSSDLPKFDITIGLPLEMVSFPQRIGQNQSLYPINVLLCSDFNESFPTTFETIDPSYLSPEIDQTTTIADAEASTAPYTSEYPTLFSSVIGASQDTDPTYSYPDTTGFASQLGSLSGYDFLGESSAEDFAHIGEHLPF
ncbi:conserved hypothetical protein [Talaromyces stipitatus ATCC 10500]|uniref:Zn(2)-C6 fungal-type domain-containing protein n=1 Tax=Talaromyces stipitatus (strain ATCC 10500 / CBS 375.48 / QM 6759 / NRRL 1006) TaxID=441959 RepID=B8LWL1_TALSN|nr:uncharacterized protein TSTA_077670 [Talaromyces stipitatus ATCC 10500]EED24408.1 conserved hypothetical protein [Talaromyces stipitatus ATCC 10500]